MVTKGTNVASVTSATAANGQTTYTVNANGAKTTAGSSAVTVAETVDTATNVTTTAVDLSAASKASLVKADNAVLYDNAGKTSVTLGGIGATPVTLKNVAAGALSTTSTDAVNGSQLNATNLNVTKNAGDINKNTGDITNLTNGTLGIVKQAVTPNGVITVGNATGGTVVDFTNGSNVSRTLTGVADGAINATSKEAINGSQLNTTNTNVTAAQTTANAAQTTANLGFNIKGGTSTADNVQLGQTVNFTSSNGNLIATNTDNTVNFQLNPILTGLTSVQAGNSLLDTNGLTITGGPSVTTAGINAGSKVISNVADGAVNATSKDAVNGSQLNTTNSLITNLTNGTTGIVRQAADTAPITVGAASNGTSVNFTNASGVNRTLTGVAAGTN